MKHNIFVALPALALLVAANVPVNAQTISATPLRSINVSTESAALLATENLPTGIAYHAGSDTLFVAGFDSRRVFKVANPTRLATPALALFADTSVALTAPAWGGGRGLQAVRIEGDQLLASGDAGTNGGVFLFDVANGTTPLDLYGNAQQLNSFNHRTGGAAFYGGNFLFTNTTGGPGGGIGLMNGAMDTLVGTFRTGILTTGDVADSFPRHLVTIGDDIYVAIAGASAPDSISKLSGGTAGQLDGKTLTNDWFVSTVATTASVGFHIAPWNYTAGSKQYLVLNRPSNVLANNAVIFIDVADPANASPLQMTNATHGIQTTRGTAIFTVEGNTYIAVTATDVTGGATGRVEIFGVDGATLADPASSVEDWVRFE